MAEQYGILVEGYNYSGVPENEFNDWYDRQRSDALKRIPGVLTAERWLNAEELSSMPGLGGANNQVAVAIYDLESPEVLRSPAYLSADGDSSAVNHSIKAKIQGVCHFQGVQTLPGHQIGPGIATGLMMFAMNVLPEVDQEFNAWFDDEHIPHLAAVPGVLAARRFKMAQGSHRYLVLYHLSTPEVQATKEWKQGGASPWTDKMKPHFLSPERNPLRLVLRRYLDK